MSPDQVMLVIKVPYDQQYREPGLLTTFIVVARKSRHCRAMARPGSHIRILPRKLSILSCKVKSVYNASKSINKTIKT